MWKGEDLTIVLRNQHFINQSKNAEITLQWTDSQVPTHDTSNAPLPPRELSAKYTPFIWIAGSDLFSPIKW